MQIETLANQVIFFYLNYAAKFESQEEIFAFLNLPLDQSKLKRQQEFSNLVVRYQNRK